MRRIVVAAAAAALLISLAPTPHPSVAIEPAKSSGPDGRLVERLDPERLSYAGSGWVRFVGGSRHAPLRGPERSRDPLVPARAFLAEYGSLFGLADPATELQARPVTEPVEGLSAVRFDQLYEGVPVLAGELAVQVDDAGAVLAVSGEVSPGLALDVSPTITAGEAADLAIAATSKANGVAPATLTAAEPTLWVYDPALLSAPAAPIARLVWRTEVVSADRVTAHDFVAVDAKSGGIALRFRDIDGAQPVGGEAAPATAPALVIAEKYRYICDRGNARSDATCGGPYARVEGGAATGIVDVDAAYDYLGDTWDYFYYRFNRVSVDNANLALGATVRFCPASTMYPCPYQNAFWDGTARQMFLGQGFVVDDVTAHELAHGVTDAESRLLYYFQSGAINEAMSDIFGELVDLGNGRGNDTTGVRWLIGEDLSIGAARNMANPPAGGQPDRMQSALYYSGTDDGGGVHVNSGVASKAAYLLADGGSFNGHTVGAIGLAKMSRIFYVANTTLLTSGSDYADLANVLLQACTSSIGSDGITSGDCTQVGEAVAAVEMGLQPVTGAAVADVPLCAPGATVIDLYTDSFESGATNWNATGSTWSLNADYATTGTHDLYGWDPDTATDTNAYMLSGVTLPAGQTYLRFNHAFEFESAPAARYDGGVVEYSVNGGTTWQDAGPLIVDTPYNGTLVPSNPLGARSAFTGVSYGYTSSRVNLASLGGSTVLFRFRIGSDASGAALGWIIDDLRVYRCSAATATAPGAPTGVSAVRGDAQATVSWSAPADTGGTPITGYTVTASTGGRTCATSGPVSCTVTGLSNGTAYTFTVKATNAVGTGPASAPSNAVTPATLPGAPTGVAAVAGDGQALVTWQAPASNGGSPITAYTVSAAPGTQTCATSGALSCSVTGLTNGTAHTFTVTAANAVGTGPASAASAPVTPSAAPPPPVLPTASITKLATWLAVTSLTVRWSGTAGTYPVASYDVRFRRAPWNGTFGATTTWKSATPATSASLTVSAGSTYCFSALARDDHDGVSGWTAETCTAIPLDDRSFTRSGSWTASTGSSYYRSTYVRSSTSGAKLTRTGVVAKRIALLATTCSTCGSVRVYWGSTLLRSISLHSATTVNKKLITVTTFTAARSGTLSIKVSSSGKKVLIDGVAISRN